MSNLLERVNTGWVLTTVYALLIALASFFVAVPGFAGEITPSRPTIMDSLKSQIESTRKVSSLESERADKRFVKKHGAALLPELETLYADEGMRDRLHEMLIYLAQDGADSGARGAAVLALVRYRLRGPHCPGDYDGWGGRVRSADFTEEARGMLREELDSQIASKGTPEPGVITLIGASGATSQLPKLRNLIPLYKQQADPAGLPPQPSQFYLHFYPPLLACARLGDKESINKCIDLIEALPDDEKVLNLETLSYVRQPEVVEYIKKFLFSDSKEHRSSRDVIEMSYAARATQALLKMLPDFPYMAPLEERRKWMSEQKQWNMIR
jgi:hypothetical protein